MMLHNTLTVRVLSFRARIIAIKFSNVFPPLASIVNAYARSKTWISVTTNPVNNGMIKYICPASDQHQLVPDIPWCSTWRTTLAGQAHTGVCSQTRITEGEAQNILCVWLNLWSDCSTTPKNCNYLIWWLFVDINSSDSYYQLGLSNRHRKLYADELKSLRQTIISGDPDCDSWPRLECPRVSTFSALLSAGSGRCWRLYLCHSGPKEGDEENIQQDGKKYFGDWYFQIFPSIWGFSPAPWWSPWCPQISADGTGTAGQTTCARWSVKLI